MLLGGLGLGSMHRAIGVFWRGVDRIQFEVYVSGIHDVVPHAGGNDERPIILNLIALIDRVT